MSCRELLELLIDYVGNELHVEQQRIVEIHLSGCPNCTILMQTYRHTIRLAGALPKCEKLPAAVEERLRAVLAPHWSSNEE